MTNKSENAYKTIGEVAEILKLKSKKKGVFSTHTIRFWERQFKQLKPKIFTGNRRYYDKDSIDTLKRIKYLLKDKGMTLNGAKKALNSENSDVDEFHNTTIKQKNIFISKVKKIKNLIETIKKNNG